jgi:hypothetical protein
LFTWVVEEVVPMGATLSIPDTLLGVLAEVRLGPGSGVATDIVNHELDQMGFEKGQFLLARHEQDIR